MEQTLSAEKRILQFVTRSNWIIFAGLSLAAIILFPPPFSKGVVAGGLIVTVNFNLLHRSLKKSFGSALEGSLPSVLVRYFGRLAAVMALIFILIANHLVNPLGLLVGLSVVVVSIILATIREIANLGRTGELSSPDEETSVVGLAYYAGLAVSVALPIFGGLVIGQVLDRMVFDTPPRFTIALLVFGVVIGFRNIGKVLQRVRKF